MDLKLGITNSPHNALDKVVTDMQTLSITLRAKVDVYRPELIIRGASLSKDVFEYNYAELPDLGGRKYFVKDIEVVNAKLFKLTLEVDVLSTYAEQIRSSHARVMRGIKHGDFVDVDTRATEVKGLGVRQSVVKKGRTVYSDVVLDDDVRTNVITVVAGGSQ